MKNYIKEHCDEFQKKMAFGDFYRIFHDELGNKYPKPGDLRSLNHQEFVNCKPHVYNYAKSLPPENKINVLFKIALYNIGVKSFDESNQK